MIYCNAFFPFQRPMKGKGYETTEEIQPAAARKLHSIRVSEDYEHSFLVSGSRVRRRWIFWRGCYWIALGLEFQNKRVFDFSINFWRKGNRTVKEAFEILAYSNTGLFVLVEKWAMCNQNFNIRRSSIRKLFMAVAYILIIPRIWYSSGYLIIPISFRSYLSNCAAKEALRVFLLAQFPIDIFRDPSPLQTKNC